MITLKNTPPTSTPRTMNSPVGKNMKEEKEERQGKNKIRVGSIVTAKVG